MTNFETILFCSGGNLSILFNIKLGGVEHKKLFLLMLYFLIDFLHTLKDDLFSIITIFDLSNPFSSVSYSEGATRA